MLVQQSQSVITSKLYPPLEGDPEQRWHRDVFFSICPSVVEASRRKCWRRFEAKTWPSESVQQTVTEETVSCVEPESE